MAIVGHFRLRNRGVFSIDSIDIIKIRVLVSLVITGIVFPVIALGTLKRPRSPDPSDPSGLVAVVVSGNGAVHGNTNAPAITCDGAKKQKLSDGEKVAAVFNNKDVSLNKNMHEGEIIDFEFVRMVPGRSERVHVKNGVVGKVLENVFRVKDENGKVQIIDRNTDTISRVNSWQGTNETYTGHLESIDKLQQTVRGYDYYNGL